MKKTILKVMIAGLFLFLSQFTAMAQQGRVQPQSIIPYPIGVTYSKTTNIIFPQAIISVDRGSRDILAQKAKGVENILQVKAARDSFPETNLTVITADGRLSSFIVNYSTSPQVLNLSLIAARYSRISLSGENKNINDIQRYAKAAFSSKVKATIANAKNSKVEFNVNGFFIHDDILYCRIYIGNSTNIKYDIDRLRFFIRDQQKAKRTALQEIEINPVYVENDTDAIGAQRSQTLVFALPKFTIPDKKFLLIQLNEKNGGRHMELHIKNRKLIKATPLSI